MFCLPKDGTLALDPSFPPKPGIANAPVDRPGIIESGPTRLPGVTFCTSKAVLLKDARAVFNNDVEIMWFSTSDKNWFRVGSVSWQHWVAVLFTNPFPMV